MKQLIIQKLHRMIEEAKNKKVDSFIANRLGDTPTLKQIETLLTKVQEDADQPN